MNARMLLPIILPLLFPAFGFAQSSYDSLAESPIPMAVLKQFGNLGEGTGSSSHPLTNRFPESLYAPAGDPKFGAGATEGNRLGDTELKTALSEGLSAWRKIGNHGGCISCHSPDGFDLALIGYSDADITRRALGHVGAGDAEQIVRLVKAMRQKHKIERPLHPQVFRPLQPGHEVLPGKRDEDRDLAFGNYLNDEIGLIWAKQRIESREQALAAQKQLLALDLRKLKVGIPFDRWSEDHFHGKDNQSVSEWIPMLGVQPAAKHVDAWYKLQDAYIADPSDANFWAFYSQVDVMLVPVEPEGFEHGRNWSLLKYKSIQVASHMLRHQALGYPDTLHGTTGGLVNSRDTVLARNPLFMTGDHVRRFPLQYDGANESTTFPEHLAETIPTEQNKLRDQNENFFRVWFWMGSIYDPALLLSDSIFQTVEGDYLYASLLARFKVHHAFTVAMKSVTKANAVGFLNAGGAGVAGHGKWAAFNPFMTLHHIERNRNEPAKNDPRRELHDRMYSNTARMWIYLVDHDLETSGTVYSKELVRGGIRFCRAWLDDTEPNVDHTQLDAVVARIEQRLDTAKELRKDFTTDDLPGGLPFKKNK